MENDEYEQSAREWDRNEQEQRESEEFWLDWALEQLEGAEIDGSMADE